MQVRVLDLNQIFSPKYVRTRRWQCHTCNPPEEELGLRSNNSPGNLTRIKAAEGKLRKTWGVRGPRCQNVITEAIFAPAATTSICCAGAPAVSCPPLSGPAAVSSDTEIAGEDKAVFAAPQDVPAQSKRRLATAVNLDIVVCVAERLPAEDARHRFAQASLIILLNSESEIDFQDPFIKQNRALLIVATERTIPGAQR